MKEYATYENLLVCPYSLTELSFQDNYAVSKETNDVYPISNEQIDLRLKRTKDVNVKFQVNNSSSDIFNFNYDELFKNPRAELDFKEIQVPYHLSKELISYIPKAKSEHSFVLDLGCDTGLHREICEHAGFKYVGADYNSKNASVLADAHALPFKDDSFEFVISIAVLEHIQHPYIMMKEVFRVLKPGGRFIGTVSFLEPFHDKSYYHHTHLGTYNSLEVGGFEVVKIAPSREWNGLTALSSMHLFSTMNPILQKLLLMPVTIFHKLWWKFKRILNRPHYHTFDGRYDILASTGAISFIAQKPVSDIGINIRRDQPIKIGSF